MLREEDELGAARGKFARDLGANTGRSALAHSRSVSLRPRIIRRARKRRPTVISTTLECITRSEEFDAPLNMRLSKTIKPRTPVALITDHPCGIDEMPWKDAWARTWRGIVGTRHISGRRWPWFVTSTQLSLSGPARLYKHRRQNEQRAFALLALLSLSF